MEQKMESLRKTQMIKFTELKISNRCLGAGAYADVYEAKWNEQTVAAKVIRNLENEARQVKERVHFEVSLAMSLHHPNIVNTFGLFESPQTGVIGIVLELADRGSLAQFLWLDDTSDALSETVKTRIALQTVDGLSYLHSKQIVHRDLKPDSILLVGADLQAKISDFGIARYLQSTMVQNSVKVGTPEYAAPELLQPGLHYTFTADIYSLSLILYEMFTKERVETQMGQNVMQIVAALMQKRRPLFKPAVLNSPCVVTLKHVIERGWADNPYQRASLADFRQALRRLITAEVKLIFLWA